MTGNNSNLPILVLAVLLTVQSPAASAAGNPPEGATPVRQQPGMDDNLEDSIPQSDLDDEQGSEDFGDTPASNDSESKTGKTSQEDLDQFEDELQLERANRGTVLLEKPDQLTLCLRQFGPHAVCLGRGDNFLFLEFEIPRALYLGVFQADPGLCDISLRNLHLGRTGTDILGS